MFHEEWADRQMRVDGRRGTLHVATDTRIREVFEIGNV